MWMEMVVVVEDESDRDLLARTGDEDGLELIAYRYLCAFRRFQANFITPSVE